MAVVSFDHVVLVAADVDATLDWYRRVLGARVVSYEEWQRGAAGCPVLHFGSQKINVHPLHAQLSPRAAAPQPGTLDLCLEWDEDADSAHRHLLAQDAHIVDGPVQREGAHGTGTSVYTRDPDQNLIELICYPPQP